MNELRITCTCGELVPIHVTNLGDEECEELCSGRIGEHFFERELVAYFKSVVVRIRCPFSLAPVERRWP